MHVHFALCILFGCLLVPREIYGNLASDISDDEPEEADRYPGENARMKRALTASQVPESLDIHNTFRRKEVEESGASSIKKMVRCTFFLIFTTSMCRETTSDEISFLCLFIKTLQKDMLGFKHWGKRGCVYIRGTFSLTSNKTREKRVVLHPGKQMGCFQMVGYIYKLGVYICDRQSPHRESTPWAGVVECR